MMICRVCKKEICFIDWNWSKIAIHKDEKSERLEGNVMVSDSEVDPDIISTSYKYKLRKELEEACAKKGGLDAKRYTGKV